MKKLLFIFIAGITLGSCNFFDVETAGFVSPETSYKDEESVQKALVGVYAPLSDLSFYGRDWFYAFNLQDLSLIHILLLLDLGSLRRNEELLSGIQERLERGRSALHLPARKRPNDPLRQRITTGIVPCADRISAQGAKPAKQKPKNKQDDSYI